jgi:hypothetical protein
MLQSSRMRKSTFIFATNSLPLNSDIPAVFSTAKGIFAPSTVDNKSCYGYIHVPKNTLMVVRAWSPVPAFP